MTGSFQPNQPNSQLPPDDDGLDGLPATWIAGIRSQHFGGSGLPKFDAEAAARRHFRRRQQRFVLLWATAAAAGLAVGVSLWAWQSNARSWPIIEPGQVAPPVAAGRTGDLNHDGVVDILDALVLAKAVEAGSADLSLDFNADNVVDRADVDRLAGAAVNLDWAKL